MHKIQQVNVPEREEARGRPVRDILTHEHAGKWFEVYVPVWGIACVVMVVQYDPAKRTLVGRGGNHLGDGEGWLEGAYVTRCFNATVNLEEV